jgi:DNA-binding NtrC family response regulator
MNERTSVLILDHDPATRSLLAQAVERLGWSARPAASALDALGLLEASQCSIVIADLGEAGVEGLEVLRRARRNQAVAEVVAIASPAESVNSAEAVRLGIAHFLVRPFTLADARRVLGRLAENRPHSDGPPPLAPYAEEALRTIVGGSPAIAKLKNEILKAAESPMPVLILGENGTGKELVARAIHACGPLRQEPFVAVDCGSLSPNLVESELFGHVRGAFTGASQTRVGLLASAGRGTILLDEIGELPLELQPRLLRALQEREVRALGSNAFVAIEARIISATNVNLKREVREGRFREDLYYRLNVFSIRIPPLRERKADILPLVHHFLERHGAARGVSDFSPEFMNRLMQFDWPGNVRQLESSVQRALAVSSGLSLGANDLPATVLYRTESQTASRDIARLQDIERRAIKEALEASAGDRIRAAKMLGIGKTTIYRKVKEYGLDDGPEAVAPPE